VGDQNMAEHAEGANTVGTSGPPQWALDLQCACEELKRVQGRELEDDQRALKAALERIYGGLEQAPPVQAFPVPDVVLLPMQTASVCNYVSGTQEFQPTASAVSAAAREAFRALKVKPELKGMESELRGLADSLRGAPASPRDPEAMAKHARYPGLDPKLPFALEPPRPTAEGHLPRLNLHALATMHKDVCDNCSKGAECYFWGFATIIDRVQIPWKDGAPPPSAVEHDRLPATHDPDLQAAVEKWASLGVAEECTRSDIAIPAHAFMAAAARTPLAPEAEAELSAGGPTAAVRLVIEADARAHAAWSAYCAELPQSKDPTKATVGTAESAAAWKRAVPRMGGPPKLRMVVAPHAVNDAAHTGHFRYEKMSQFLSQLQEGYALAIADIANFFYCIEIHPDAQKFFGFPILWKDANGALRVRWWRLKRLPMGFGAAPFLASLLSAILMDIFRKRVRRDGPARGIPGGTLASLIFVDDGLLAAATRAACGVAVGMYKEVLREAGLQPAEEKSTQVDAQGDAGSPRATMLGFAVATDPLSLTLPPQKLVKTAATMRVVQLAAQAKVPIPRYLLAATAGLTTRLLEACGHLAPRTREIVSATYAKHGAERWRDERKRVAVLRELDFLLSAAEHGGWGAKRLLARVNPARTLPLMTDASGDGVIAIVIPGIAACVFKLQQANRFTVPELELAGALLALIRYGPLLRGWALRHATDAAVAAFWLWRNRGSTAPSNDMLAAITALCARYGISIHTAWLSRWANWLADRLATGESEERLAELGVPLPPVVMTVPVEGNPTTTLMAIAGVPKWSTE
jgi:hypothetical protein